MSPRPDLPAGIPPEVLSWLRNTPTASLFDTSPFPMAIIGRFGGPCLVANEALVALTGYRRGDLTASSIGQLIHPEDQLLARAAADDARAAPGAPSVVELRLITASGGQVLVRTTFTAVDGPDGHLVLLTQSEDLTARRAAEAALRSHTDTDELTGLGNRSWLVGYLSQLQVAGESVGVLLIDLDGFSLINDTRGHQVGDEVLREVARRLRNIADDHHPVSRFGGDEFVVINPAEAGEVISLATELLAEQIMAAIAVPIATSSGPVHLTASIGIYDGTDLADGDPLQIVGRADNAMHLAKQHGKARFVTYTSDVHQQNTHYIYIERLLQNALAEQRLVLHYQPIVRIDTSTVVSVEALLRLLDHDGKLISPDRFIPVAERSGLIFPIGSWVLTESCRQIAQLRRDTRRQLRVSVNIAACQAARADLPDIVTAALEDAGLPPDALVLEVTESALLDAGPGTLQHLWSLRERGVGIAIDDFGTGYSSLTYLRQLPVTDVKIDRSFVTGMTEDSGDAVIVKAVTWLARELNMTWIAEGIETREQWAALQKLGQGLGQGYFFARPMPASALVAHLRDSRGTQ